MPRLGLRWSSYRATHSRSRLRALYYYEVITEMQRPCFTPTAGPVAWNLASDMCKAALHQNEYRDWNPFIVIFPLNERHVVAALTFAARHRLCIATAGIGHEYNSRNSCPTGGLLIRTILLKDKAFMPTWREDPALAPAGAFRFGAAVVFAEMHAFSAKYARVIASGWCSTIGMVGFHLDGGHGPLAPSMGLGVDNVLKIKVLQAMRGVWGVVLSMTIRAHAVPDGGLSRVFIPQNGTFCPDSRPFGYQWLRDVDSLRRFNFEYFYAGGQAEPDYILFRDRLKDLLQTTAVQEHNFKSAYEYILSMPADKFLLAVTNPPPAPHPPSDAATGSQNLVFVSRQAMETKFASTMMDVLDICVASLKNPDPTSPDPAGHRCGFHFLYTSLTGNLGSLQPGDTAISPGFRSALIL
ncbi:hypothetical protein BHE90_012287 [Fusarium euwallaceae]|uniref:FAD-binding PCMH-type domain-containing protein n=1 Tax=Fusarium euwallaceae TaxID=1147111 RepID=A0A430LC60_9HYPO|nr:hypothetical protein BHE90_012287 [Fusarium euwallaceae]